MMIRVVQRRPSEASTQIRASSAMTKMASQKASIARVGASHHKAASHAAWSMTISG
jgi:hypothetical protein